jgi:hypothetical protein
VQESDRARARALIRKAVHDANEQWIPIDALAEALVHELAMLGGHAASRIHICAYLRHVAEALEVSEHRAFDS